MASAGQFVRERIPIPASVPEAGRLVLELVASSRDSQAEAAGPMTFRLVRKYRPTWASVTGFLIAPLFVRNTEVCRVAVIEARVGAELLLEGAIDPELHARLVQLGRVPFLGPLANIRQSTPGDDQTLLRGSMPWTGPEPFLNTHAAGFRGVFDFSDPDASVFIVATGESGHPLSRFYDNLGELWRRGEYIPMSLDPELARAAATGIMVLTPEVQ